MNRKERRAQGKIGLAPRDRSSSIVDGMFATAIRHYQAGRLNEADALYQQVLAIDSRHADSLHMRGLIAQQMGRHNIAIELIERAITTDTRNALYRFNLGNIFRDVGRLDDAVACYRKSILLTRDVNAYNNLGTVLAIQGNLREAANAFRRVIDLVPTSFEAHYNLGNALHDLKQYDDAIALFKAVICLKPDFADAYNNLGNALRDSARFEEAVSAFYRGSELQPNSADIHNNLGAAFSDLGRFDDAIVAFRNAVDLQPDFAAAYYNLGNSLKDNGQLDEAVAVFHQCIALRPDFEDAYTNLGAAFYELGRSDDGIVAYERAIHIKPNCPNANFSLANMLLLKGAFLEGWMKYEWRFNGDKPVIMPREFSKPVWTGDNLAGKTILLYGEQGLGDQIQFSRYASLLASGGARVILETTPELTRLLRTVPGVAQVIAMGDDLPNYDYHLSMMSAPYRCATTLDTIPLNIPYVSADATQAKSWLDRLTCFKGIKVGLVWAGAPRLHHRTSHAIDRRRSMTLAQMTPLLDLPGVTFISLQKGAASAQLDTFTAAVRPHDWMGQMNDYADTAALVANLDLVITVDTSVAHLAGALGKPVWILSRFDGCWRWLLDRDDSPWYPTARLFRQPAPGDWETVIEKIGCELRRLAKREDK